MDTNYIIETKNLTKQYGSQKSVADLNIHVKRGRIYGLHNLDLPVGKIVTAFVENGLEVSEVHTCEESLEDYFKRVTGGEGIA